MKGHKRYRSGAWRLVVHTGVDPATGRRRSIHETVHGPENRVGAKAADARLAELIAAVESGREIERFHRSVLGEEASSVSSPDDPYQLASLRNYRSLMPLAQDARKPMFDLRPGDGALGSTGRLVQTCFREFEGLALQVMKSADIALRIPS